jgi:hypothetical protein
MSSGDIRVWIFVCIEILCMAWKQPKCTNIYLFCVLSDEIIVEHCNSDYRRICLSRKEARELYTHPGPHDNS